MNADRMKDEYPDRLTYSKSEGIAILSVAPLLREYEPGPHYGWPKVFHEGEWWTLCRADLMGQVSSGCGSDKSDLETVRQAYLGRIRMGVRLHRERNWPPAFQCIDSLTDG